MRGGHTVDALDSRGRSDVSCIVLDEVVIRGEVMLTCTKCMSSLGKQKNAKSSENDVRCKGRHRCGLLTTYGRCEVEVVYQGSVKSNVDM